MIRLRLQWFGRGKSGGGGGGAGGGGTKADSGSKSVTKQAVSDNQPGYHGSAGGRKMDTAGTNHTVSEQRRVAPSDNDYITNTTLKEKETYVVYQISHGKESIYNDSVIGFRINQFMMYNAREGYWRDRHGNRFKVKRAKTK